MVYSSDALPIWYSWRILNIKIDKEEEKVKLIFNLTEKVWICMKFFILIDIIDLQLRICYKIKRDCF